MNAKIALLFMLFTFALAACTPPPPQIVPTETGETATATTDGDIVTLTVLYTNDEHGWMLGQEEGRGAANMAGLWQEKFGYGGDSNFLVLSGGDNWTGPAISTWFQGESMVEVMNTMGYDASVIGNHEFDFGLETLQQRLGEADFPYLSANIRYKDNGEVPTDLGIQPYALVGVGGLEVGLIGLTTTNTAFTTNPANIADFEFIGYTEALREFVPELQAAGADLIFVPGHLCTPEIAEVTAVAEDLNIDFVGGGHCNELVAAERNGAVTLVGGAHLATYAWATFTYDTATNEVLTVDYGVEQNEGGAEDPTVAAVVAKWQAETDATLSDVIGYLEEELPRRGQAIEDLITESWLWGYPQADIALTNRGGIRVGIPAGDVTLAEIIGVLPFNNVLIEVHLTGKQLEQALVGHLDRTAVGGMHRVGFHWVLDATGERLDKDAVYSVLVNDFMYAGGDDYTLFAHYDPDAYDTGIDWRQPVIDWILDQDSSPDRPLDEAIASLAD